MRSRWRHHPAWPDAFRIDCLTAIAEVTWTPATKKNYEDFLKRMRVHEGRYRALDMNFRPVPEAPPAAPPAAR